MIYQIYNNRSFRCESFHVMIIIAKDPESTVFDRRLLSFVFDFVKRNEIEEFSIELVSEEYLEKGQGEWLDAYWSDCYIPFMCQMYIPNETAYVSRIEIDGVDIFDINNSWQDYYFEEKNGSIRMILDDKNDEQDKMGTEYEKLYDSIMNKCSEKFPYEPIILQSLARNRTYKGSYKCDDDKCDAWHNSPVNRLIRILNEFGQNVDVFVRIIVEDYRIKPAIPTWFIKNLLFAMDGSSETFEENKKCDLCPYNRYDETYSAANNDFHYIDESSTDLGHLLFQNYPHENYLVLHYGTIHHVQPLREEIKRKEAELKKKKVEAQNWMYDLKNRLCEKLGKEIYGRKKMSYLDASTMCNLKPDTWNAAFTIDAETSRSTVFAIAIGLKMPFYDFIKFLWLNGFIIRPMYNLVDAVVEAAVRNIEKGYEIELGSVNQILSTLNEKSLSVMDNRKKNLNR